MTIYMPHSAAVVLVRILIGSYFAACTGLIDPLVDTTFLGRLLGSTVAETVTVAILYGTAFAIMIGRFVRPAALFLASFFFWASYIPASRNFTLDTLADFWADMALVGALLLIALLQPGGSRGLRFRRVQPRRLKRPQGGVVSPRTPRPEAIGAGMTARFEHEDEDKMVNLFTDLGPDPRPA